jgi:hypothetical protein
MSLAIIGLGVGAATFLGGQQRDRDTRAQVDAANQAAMANYRLALADRAMVAQQRALQGKFQEEASAVELVRQTYEEAGIRISQGFRMQDRRREGLEAQVQAVSQRGAIEARAGAANVAGVTARALTRLTEASAARYIGALQEEERRDIATTNLQVRDSRMASAQRIQQINQPLGGLPGVAPPVITPQPRSSSFLNVLGGISTGLQLYAGLGGRFPTGPSQLATPGTLTNVTSGTSSFGGGTYSFGPSSVTNVTSGTSSFGGGAYSFNF